MRFIENLNDCFLYQCVRENTFRASSSVHGSLLDLIITNNIERILDVKIAQPLKGDEWAHSTIVWRFAYGMNQIELCERMKRFNLKNGNYDKMNDELRLFEWDKLFENKNTNESRDERRY